MATDNIVNELIVNTLTQAQFDAIPEAERSDTELYFITDSEGDGGKGAQVEEMPEATEMNVGQIVQYIGETITDEKATVIITQIVGDSLTNLKVDAKKFEKASGLTETGSLEFVADITALGTTDSEITTTDGYGQFVTFYINNSDVLINQMQAKVGNAFDDAVFIIFDADFADGVMTNIGLTLFEEDYQTILLRETSDDYDSVDSFMQTFSISCQYSVNDNFSVSEIGTTIMKSEPTWFLNNKTGPQIDIQQYGISYSGTLFNGDTLKVDYTPFVGGYEKGYFYVNQAQLSEEIITINQTVGNSLTNLSIDINTFKEVVAPEFDTIIDFIAQVETESSEVSTVTFDAAGGLVLEATAEAIRNLYLDKLSIDLEDPEHESKCNTLYIDYVNDADMGIGYNNNYITSVSRDVMSEYGITIIGEPSSNNMTHGIYTPRGGSTSTITWLANGNLEVDILSYGISYSGTPSDGDTLSVNYFIPSVVAYNWNQINVQPASKGNGGIEWVTKLDLPANFQLPNIYNCYPIWTIPGGIPDGTYEFYLETLCGMSERKILARAQHYTLKATVTFSGMDTSWPQVTGVFSYVLDGSWTGDEQFKIPMNELTYQGLFKKHNTNGDLYFYSTQKPFASVAPGYVDSTKEIPEIFKITALKNINTGDLYYPEGVIYDGTNHPTQYTNIPGSVSLCQLLEPIYYPNYYSAYAFDVTSQSQLILIDNAINTPNGYSNYQELTIYMKTTSGGKYHAIIKNTLNSCYVKVLEFSGDLAHVQIGYVNSDGNMAYIYLNNENITSVEISVSASGVGNTQQPLNISQHELNDTILELFNVITEEKVGSIVNNENIDTILQYKHESTNDYIHGYFYKAVGDKVTTPASVNVFGFPDGVEISVNNPELLVEKLADITGMHESSVIQHINYGWYNWVYNANYIHWGLHGDMYDAELVDCFTVSGLENTNGNISFQLSKYKESGIEIVNGRWEQVNVQPASNTVQVAEMPEASEENVGKILQYIGTPTSEYDQGYFYKCTADGWVQVNVQPSSGGGGEAPSELPNLTGNEGRFLSNNGSELEWVDIPTSLPAQEGHSGKYLTTDGTNLSWADVSSGGGTVSGDYLPLSGGTLTGALKLHENMWDTDIVLEALDYGAMGGTVLNISGGTIVAGSIHPSESYSSLGTPYDQEVIDSGGGYGAEGLYYQRVCAKALNNGTTNDDIVIPNKSGTLALIEDIESIIGDLSSALDTINGEEI